METKDSPSRDLESEREEFLAVMNSLVSPELKRRIDEAISVSVRSPQIKVTTSNRGAFDADTE